MSSNLIETICIRNQRVQRINFHNDRCNNTRQSLFNEFNNINLRDHIDTSIAPDRLTKCRITYNQDVVKVEYEPYILRPINSLRLIDIGNYNYAYKYTDRSELDHFFGQKGKADDILMIKDGLITDTYYANVALLKNGVWFTPEEPLLKGTMRSYLLGKGKIVPTKIRPSELQRYETIRLFNAMMEFGDVEFSTRLIQSYF